MHLYVLYRQKYLKFCQNIKNVKKCNFREFKSKLLLMGHKINGKLHGTKSNYIV
jgi:hypothetical protein